MPRDEARNPMLCTAWASLTARYLLVVWGTLRLFAVQSSVRSLLGGKQAAGGVGRAGVSRRRLRRLGSLGWCGNGLAEQGIDGGCNLGRLGLLTG